MLQWMGGSRRKVTASRKSTQKRQRQYFEQRKRQQQEQKAGVESFSDEVNSCSRHPKNNRSLDILSLLSLSTVVQERRPSFLSARENPEDDRLTVKCPEPKCLPAIQSNKLTPVDPIQFKNARSPSSYQVGTVYPMQVQVSPTDRNRGLHLNNDKPDQLKLASEHQLSVIDLLGDDGQNGNSGVSPVREAHVSFSIEGLGKVETETPVHSPQQSARTFAYGCSSPSKASKRSHSSKNLSNVMHDIELEVDAMIQDINTSISGSSLDLPFCCSRGILESFSNPKQKLPMVNEFNDCSALDGNDNKMRNLFGDEEVFYNIDGKNESRWKASSGYLDHSFLDEGECDISWKNWPCNRESSSTDYLSFGQHEMSDFAFEGPYLQRRRTTKSVTQRFNITESLTPYCKYQAADNDHDLITPDGTWYPKFGRHSDVKDVINQPAWSCFVTEDARESLSLLSEESCSSSAVRVNASNRSPTNSIAKPNTRRHGGHHRSAESKFAAKSSDAGVTYCKNRDDFQQRQSTNVAGNFMSKPNPSRSRPAHYLDSAFKGKKGSEDSCFYEKAYTPGDLNSGFGFLCQTSWAKKYGSSSDKLWTDHTFETSPVPELRDNTKSSFERSKLNVPAESSPFRDFFSENFSFPRSFSHVHSSGISNLSNIGSGLGKPNLSPDSDMESRPKYSLPIAGSQGERGFPYNSLHESVGKIGESKAEIQPTDCSKFEVQEEVCFGIDGLSSDNEKPMEVSDSVDNSYSECEEANAKTPEMMEVVKTTCSPEHTVETSSSVMIPDELESSVDEKEYGNDVQTSLPCQKESKDIEDFGPKGSRTESNG